MLKITATPAWRFGRIYYALRSRITSCVAELTLLHSNFTPGIWSFIYNTVHVYIVSIIILYWKPSNIRHERSALTCMHGKRDYLNSTHFITVSRGLYLKKLFKTFFSECWTGWLETEISHLHNTKWKISTLVSSQLSHTSISSIAEQNKSWLCPVMSIKLFALWRGEIEVWACKHIMFNHTRWLIWFHELYNLYFCGGCLILIRIP